MKALQLPIAKKEVCKHLNISVRTFERMNLQMKFKRYHYNSTRSYYKLFEVLETINKYNDKTRYEQNGIEYY